MTQQAGVQQAGVQQAGVEHLDVVVVGAGLSGIGAAATLRRRDPGLALAVLESRDAIGGTWDLFRYPGVRSDSDVYTLGYAARPWLGDTTIAAGAEIRDYIRAAADEGGVRDLIRFRERVVAASWRSDRALWELTVVRRDPRARGEWREGEAGTARTMTCSFLFACTGYYRYDRGHTPEIPGLGDFAGPVVHPQHWPADLDPAGKRFVVIGSGATAVTLLPSLAKMGAHAVMLQRSPSYVAAVPSRDRLARRLRGRLPASAVHRVVRTKHVLTGVALYQFARRRPAAMRAKLMDSARAKLPATFDVDTHFGPRYDPWDQRLCAAPGGDLFRAISAGGADVVTGRIDRVDATGIALESGERVDADVIVTATGLDVLMLGGMRVDVDGRVVDVGGSLAHRGMMLDGVPNLAYTIGYTNSSWTLRADLVATAVADLLARMRRRGDAVVTPHAPPGEAPDGSGAPVIDLASGYLRRGGHLMPRQGRHAPWTVSSNYLRDLLLFRADPRQRGLTFSPAPAAAPTAREAA